MTEIEIVQRCPHQRHQVTWLLDGQPSRLPLRTFFEQTLKLIQESYGGGHTAGQLRSALQAHFERFDDQEYRYITLVEDGPHGPVALVVVLERLHSGDSEVTTYAAVAGFIGYGGQAYGTTAEGQPVSPPLDQSAYDTVTKWALVNQRGLSSRSESWLANRGRLGKIGRVANAGSYVESVVLALGANITSVDAVALPLPAAVQPDAVLAATAYLMMAGFRAYHLIPSGLDPWRGRLNAGAPQDEPVPDLLFLSAPVDRTRGSERVIEDTPPL